MIIKLLCNFIIIWPLFDIVQASLGDRLKLFQYYLTNCIRENCTRKDSLSKFEINQPLYLKFLGWNCQSECQYECQWKTIIELKNNYNYYRQPTPQFYGKWTFYRLFGIQEPASFIFSFTNLLTNYYCWSEYRLFGQYSNDPLYNLWKMQAFISMNAWFWSMMFHARETPFTEKMDYFSAYLIVIFLLYTITVKLLIEVLNFNINKNVIQFTIAIPFVGFYLNHLRQMYGNFDYGYNMQINVITGMISTILWSIWCFRNRHQRPHVRKCFFSLLFINLCLTLELFDFEPIFYTFDAHSLWHLATTFFPFFWYSFLKDEAIYYLIEINEIKQKLL